MAQLAKSIGLLHLPKMPELKNMKVNGFEQLKMDYALIPFKDKVREKARLSKRAEEKKLDEQKKLELKILKRKENSAWSDKKDQKEKRGERKLKRLKKKEAILKKQVDDQLAQKGKQEEWLELQEEARVMKKGNKKRGNQEEEDDDDSFSASDED